MPKARAIAAFDRTSPLGPHTIDRREPGPTDVELDILYCGVCHSDLHTARSEWKSPTTYPCVPGHEIVGRVTRVGEAVSGFRQGQLAGVGCMVDSCGTCPSCREGLQQYCSNNDTTWTYNSVDKHMVDRVTYGGYTSHIVVDQGFCLRIADGMSLPAVAPLLCAGITMYSPLKHWGAAAGKKVGIVGLGGLGHMGIKLAHAFGAETVLFTTSPGKAEDARRLGADDVVLSRDPVAMQAQAGSFDLIVNTVAVSHDLDAYTALLRRDGALVLVGVPELAHPSPSVGNLIGRRRSIAGSLIGGIPQTQEMLDFCAEKGIVSDVEIISAAQINDAYERMLKNDVKYRFVIDLGSLA